MTAVCFLRKRHRSESRWVVPGKADESSVEFNGVSPRFAEAAKAPGFVSLQSEAPSSAELAHGLEALEALPHDGTSGGRWLWRRMNMLGISIAIFAIPAWAWFYVLMHAAQGFGDTWGVGIMLGVTAMIPAYALVISIAHMILPLAYFEREATGRRIMRLLGAKSATMVRPLASFCPCYVWQCWRALRRAQYGCSGDVFLNAAWAGSIRHLAYFHPGRSSHAAGVS